MLAAETESVPATRRIRHVLLPTEEDTSITYEPIPSLTTKRQNKM